MSKPIRLGLLGVGGYAVVHQGSIFTLEDYGECELVAVGDPFVEQRAEAVAALKARGVEIYEDPDKVIARADIDALVIATPIHHHVPQSLAALESGKHVYLEKPPCATLGEHAQLVTARQKAGKVGIVGFQNQATPSMKFLKQSLVDGAIGSLKSISASIRWRRDDAYYARSNWAAKWEVDGRPVFDGPATNALAHVVHGAMFLAGDPASEYADVKRVRGVLKKARPVESFDTAFIEVETVQGVLVRLALTHASAATDSAELLCVGDSGSATIDWSGNVGITSPNGNQKLTFHYQSQVAVLLNYFRSIHDPSQRPFTSFEDTLAYVRAVSGAAQSSGGSSPFPAELVQRRNDGQSQDFYEVAGMDAQFEALRRDETAIPGLLAPGAWLDAEQLSPGLSRG